MKVLIGVGHWNIENITSKGLRSWRSSSVLKRSTGASGERNYHWKEWMPRLRDKLIAVGIQVYITDAIYNEITYSQDYDLCIWGHYDGGGTSERCMVSAPNRATKPDYLNNEAMIKSEAFADLWKNVYPDIVGVPYKANFISAGMKDYYAFDYIGMDTPTVIVEHFNHTSPRGQQLKQNAELVAEADFQTIIKFLGIEIKPPEPTDPCKNQNEQLKQIKEALGLALNSPIDTIVKSIAGTKGAVTALQSQVAEANGKLLTRKGEVDRLKERLLENQNTIKTLQKEREKLDTEYNSTLKTLKEQIEGLTKQNETLNINLEKCKAGSPSKCDEVLKLLKKIFRIT